MNGYSNNDIRVDERLYIEELQRYLQIIQWERQGFTTVPADGIFGSNTADAVRQFQRQEGLPDNGIVDHDTWNAIATEAAAVEERNAAPLGLGVYRQGQTPLQEGDVGDDVTILQIILRYLGSLYSDLPSVDQPDGRYSSNTAAVIRAIQQRSGLPITGITDKATWNAIVRLYDR